MPCNINFPEDILLRQVALLSTASMASAVPTSMCNTPDVQQRAVDSAVVPARCSIWEAAHMHLLTKAMQVPNLLLTRKLVPKP